MPLSLRKAPEPARQLGTKSPPIKSRLLNKSCQQETEIKLLSSEIPLCRRAQPPLRLVLQLMLGNSLVGQSTQAPARQLQLGNSCPNHAHPSPLPPLTPTLLPTLYQRPTSYTGPYLEGKAGVESLTGTL